MGSPVDYLSRHRMGRRLNQNTIFITSTIRRGSETSSTEEAANCAKLGSVTLLDARFPNQGWLNELWKSARSCQRTRSLIGNSLYTEISQTFRILLLTSGNMVGKVRSVNGAWACVGKIDVLNQTSYEGSNWLRPAFWAAASLA